MLELNHGFRIVDAHSRLGAGADAARGRRADAESLEREMHQSGVVRAVVFADRQPEGEGYVRANNAVARHAVERPFVAFARINGPREPGGGAGSRLRNLTSAREDHHTDPEDVERYAYDERFHGFKLDPVRDGLPDEGTLAALGDAGLPVVVHGGEGFPPSAVERTLLEYDFPLVLSHFGGHPLHRGLMNEAVDALDEHDNLYLDTSAVRYRSELERAIREHPDRPIFGSGAPAVHPNVAAMEVLTLNVPEDAMRRVFSKNAERVVPALAP
jgi:predicted TIM-barrel fold metal-dependent hydrolase